MESTPIASINSKDYALSLGAQTSRNRPSDNLLDGLSKKEIPQVNQFRTDDKNDDELIENEIFLSPIVESALCMDIGARQEGDDYVLSPDGPESRVITRRSSRNELALSINS